MGKRELLIVLAFVVVGTVAFRFTAPPDTSASGGFSFGELFRAAGRGMRGNPGQGTFVHKAVIPAPQELRELRLIGTITGVTVTGEDRDTIEYEFTVTSTGPDDAGAEELAKQTVLEPDDLGDALVLRARFPEPASQRAAIVMRVPRRLAIRIESGRNLNISHVAGLHLESVRGDVEIKDVTGAITGAQQDGDFSLAGATSMKMRLTRSQATLSGLTDGATLDLRDGEFALTDSSGPIEIDETRTEISISNHRGATAIRGSDGRITLKDPSDDTRIDVRRAEVELTLTRGVTATVITTDEPLRLIVTGTPSFTVDAAATDGEIQASDLELTPETSDRSTKLQHTFGSPNGPRLTLRNNRGDIILRKTS